MSHCQVKVSIMLYRIVHVQYWIKFKDLPSMRDKWISKCFQFCLDDHSDVQTWSKLLQNLRQEEGEDEKRLQERNKSRVEREGEREREEEEVGRRKCERKQEERERGNGNENGKRKGKGKGKKIDASSKITISPLSLTRTELSSASFMRNSTNPHFFNLCGLLSTEALKNNTK